MAEKSDSEYKKLGFMCGLEIHQRLDTREKLFCGCSTEPDADLIAKVSRNQRAVAGELGEIDPSAKFEENKRRRFTYNVFKDSTCLVDIDEEPPHEVNREALMIALSMAESMKMRVSAELEPMRKEVVDGSDPSAFQRTILLGYDGSINVNGVEIGIPFLALEEESSGIESSKEDGITYNVDRLGVPLIEIDTFPYIPTPAMAKETALYIGTLLRITGKVKRGIGTIRQDVNVSIKGGARVEIKGLQDISQMDRFIENEIRRQRELLGIREKLKSSKARVHEPVEVTKAFSNTGSMLVRRALERNGCVFAFGLEGFKGVLGKEINPDRRLGSEISDYAKMGGVNGIIHSDESMEKYGFKDEEMRSLGKALSLKDGDSFIIVTGERKTAEKAARLAMERAKYALIGVPLETRGSINDESATTRFLRPLPGGSRMYPETDAKPIRITEKLISEARASAPNLDMEKGSLEKELSDPVLAGRMLMSPRLPLYKRIISSTKADKKFVANVLLQKFTELSRGGVAIEGIREERIIETFDAYANERITKQAIDEILKSLAKKDSDVGSIVKGLSLERISGKRLEELVSSFKSRLKTGDRNQLRNEIMAKHRLNVDGEELNRLL